MNSESKGIDLFAMTRTTDPIGGYLASRVVLCEIIPPLGGDFSRWAVWEEIIPEDPTAPRYFAHGDYFGPDELAAALVIFTERATRVLDRWQRNMERGAA